VIRAAWILLLCSYGALALAEEKSVPLAQMLCMQGNCFVRRHGSATIYPVPASERRDVRQNDVVISVGLSSRVEIIFDDKTKVYLRDSGLYRVRKGEKDVLLAQGNEMESSQKGFNPEDDVNGKGNLIFIGDLALKVLTPKFGEKLIFSSFPQTIRVAFELPSDQAKDEKLEELKVWRLLRLESSSGSIESIATSEDFGNVVFTLHDNEKKSVNYYGNASISRDGSYLLLPEVEYLRGQYSGIRMDVGGREALKQSIRDMLKGAEENPDASIELRGN